MPLSRRQMLYALSIGSVGAAFDWHGRAYARQTTAAAGTPALAALNRFPRMVQEFFVARENALHQQRVERLALLQTKADAEAYVQAVRRKIRESFGPFPEKTPLNPRVTKVVERDAYTIENVLFESRPGFLVSANLYVPRGRRFPLPGVVGSCGHSANGKAIDTYQSFCQGLARLGYVVLIFDPIGQGERMQYVDANWKPRRGVGTAEHNYAGIQQVLVDERFCTWRAWDGIRALDYLITREEVDTNHLGITGNSGGGTMTTWLCGLDDRWTMAAPSCFVTELRRNMENELGADIEQIPPRALALGLDHEDFLAALAPKPVIILAKEKDYFDVRGTISAYERLKGLYRLLGAEDNVACFVGPTYHGYSQENREAMYRWFNRCTGISDATAEPTLALEKEETLWCTPRGQVAELGSKPVHDFTREKSTALASKRGSLDPEALGRSVAATLRLPERSGAPEFRILRPLPDRRYPLRHALPYMVESDRHVYALVYRLTREPLFSRPPRETRHAILYISDESADAELRSEPLVRELIESDPDAAFHTCDVRGIGESSPQTASLNRGDEYTTDYLYASHALLLDYPSLGQRTFDVLRVLDWLAACGYDQVHLAARGQGAAPAAFAALLSPTVTRVTLKHPPASYAAIAESPDYDWPLSALPPGVLTRFDLPDCYAALRAKHLRLLEPLGATGRP
ncbi:MAG TPA: prolyl oligopeptidase family serine peptidase [Vicinamibacterales bacterium]|nr:prolyl oligopeptidase family serine peptidase [Vicinamibacterales bacterium]